jgi:ubiquitin carboxyl-terminal hydrolase 4/11/15
MKDDKGFSTTDSDIGDVYPLQLRLSVQRETKSFEVRISKKVYVLYSLKE